MFRAKSAEIAKDFLQIFPTKATTCPDVSGKPAKNFHQLIPQTTTVDLPDHIVPARTTLSG